MALILNIETSTPVCSVAISQDSKIIGIRESSRDKSHAAHLAPFIHEILEKNPIEKSNLDAVAVSRGPGSYTGLRIGVSTAKGITYALNKPLIAVDTLQAMTYGVVKKLYRAVSRSFDPDTWLCPMIDARRMEVYSAFFDIHFKQRREINAEIIDTRSFQDILSRRKVLFFGTGAEKCKTVLKHPNASFIDHFFPTAEYMVPFSEEKFHRQEFENTAYFEPFYLKDFIATIPRKNIFT
jgi:tRNA threonylcarbamoyladenosine biosynthesis protein TsaB